MDQAEGDRQPRKSSWRRRRRVVVLVVAMNCLVVNPAHAYATHGCQFDSAQPPSITYKFHSVISHNQTAFNTAQSEWDVDTSPTTYFVSTTGGDPNIDVYDGNYADSWSALTSWSCWYIPDPNTYVGDEVMIQFNENHMPSSTRGKWVTASHELGHAYGLGHVSMTCSYPKVMEQGTEKYGCSGNPPWTDDVSGWNSLY